MTKLGKLAAYTTINSVFLYAIYVGFEQGHEGFRNVSYFIAWIMIFISIILLCEVLCAEKEGRPLKEISNEPKIIPEWFDIVYDFSVSVLFAYYGAWITAVGYLLHTIVIHGYRNELTKQKNTVDN